MDADLAEAFAEILDDIWSRPWLGNATTGQLLDEVKARVDCDYKTVGGEEIAERLPHTADSDSTKDWILYHLSQSGNSIHEGQAIGLFTGTEYEVHAYCDKVMKQIALGNAEGHYVGYKQAVVLSL